MFWTVIRWGGSVAVILLVLAAAFLASQSGADSSAMPLPAENEATPVELTPSDAAPPQNKNFNL